MVVLREFLLCSMFNIFGHLAVLLHKMLYEFVAWNPGKSFLLIVFSLQTVLQNCLDEHLLDQNLEEISCHLLGDVAFLFVLGVISCDHFISWGIR